MPKCPNCGQPAERTEDWACRWCGYPLLSPSYRKIPKTYEQLKTMADRLSTGVKQAAAQAGLPVYVSGIASMFTTFFTDQEVTDYATAATSDTKRYGAYFHAMLKRGVYLAPSQFEAGFVSLAHGEEDITATIAACREAMSEISGGG